MQQLLHAFVAPLAKSCSTQFGNYWSRRLIFVSKDVQTSNLFVIRQILALKCLVLNHFKKTIFATSFG